MGEESGFVSRNGLQYVRVSEVLESTLPVFHPKKAEGFNWWRNNYENAEEILAISKRRGTLVHFQITKYLLDGAFSDEKPTVGELMYYNIPGYMAYAIPLLGEILAQNGPDSLWPGLLKNSLVAEQRFFSKYGFSGKPDLKLWWNGKYTIWDWKSARSITEPKVKKKNKPISKYSEGKIQLSGYSLHHNIEARAGAPPIEQCVICILYDWCEPFVHVMNLDHIKKAANEFIERYEYYQQVLGKTFPSFAN